MDSITDAIEDKAVGYAAIKSYKDEKAGDEHNAYERATSIDKNRNIWNKITGAMEETDKRKLKLLNLLSISRTIQNLKLLTKARFRYLTKTDIVPDKTRIKQLLKEKMYQVQS